MFVIDSFQTKNFRNLQEEPVFFNRKVNFFYGKNGSGKTNFLEALYILFQRKSFKKNNNFAEILSIDGDFEKVYFSAAVEKEGEKHLYSAYWESQQKEYFLNKQLQKKNIFLLPEVILPYEPFMFFFQASIRRQWLDECLSKMDLEYENALKRFNKGIKQKRKILQIEKYALLKTIQEELAHSMEVIYRKRALFCQEVISYIGPTWTKIYGAGVKCPEIKMSYKTEYLLEMSLKSIGDLLHKKEGEEKEKKRTLIGPHLDDLEFYFDGYNYQEWASTGQLKALYLALRFAYMEFFRYKKGESPVVFIDDISGELDQNKWVGFLNYASKSPFQCFITSASEEFSRLFFNSLDVRSFIVNQGIITEK